LTWHRGSFHLIAAATCALLAFVAVAIARSSDASAAAACDRFASPTGSDSASGAAGAPVRTAQRLADTLSPGQTGCLRAGTYAAEQTKVRKPNVTLTSYPGERATLRGQLRFEAEADGAVVEDLVLDGRNARSVVGPLIYADGVVLRDNNISNGNSQSSCVHLDSYPGSPAPRGVVIEGNRIHDCGKLPATNKNHGIYVGDAQGTVIRDNAIYDNADRGIQLYPNADGTRVTGNVIDGNGVGIIFGSDDETSPDGNVVEGNLITNSRIRYNVESHSQGAPYGRGNVVRGNCIHGGARHNEAGGVQTPSQGFVATDNKVADPRYVNREAKNFALQADSPCKAVFDGSGGGGAADGARGGQPKLTLAAGRSRVQRGTRVRLHGRSRLSAPTVQIMRLSGSRWKPVRQVRAANGPYIARGFLINRRQVRFKAQVGGVTSQPIRVRGRSRR
jgi:parallel beta-helix repeat protein